VGERFGYQVGDLPVTEELSARLVRLPFYCELAQTEQMEIVSRIEQFLTGTMGRRAAA
jgi:dTDP-4-amino-4,6-dideoxygalactose transaminase